MYLKKINYWSRWMCGKAHIKFPLWGSQRGVYLHMVCFN